MFGIDEAWIGGRWERWCAGRLRACHDGGMRKGDEGATVADRPTGGAAGDDRVLIQRMLELTPEQRLLGLVRAAAFFGDARRV